MLNCATVQEELEDDADDCTFRLFSSLRPRNSAAKEPRYYSNPFLTRRHGDAPLPDAPTQFHTETARLQEGAFDAMAVTALLHSCEQPFSHGPPSAFALASKAKFGQEDFFREARRVYGSTGTQVGGQKQ